MNKKQTSWPFQEGYVLDGAQERHAFTDYRWNDGSVTRRWMVDPSKVDLATVVLRPFSLSGHDETNQ